MVRNANIYDVSRIAEILIFAKRTAYRSIFNNDEVSFNEMQVLDLALALQKDNALDNILVYDDGIVRGMIKRELLHDDTYNNSLIIHELYVYPFFQSSGVGGKMMQYLLEFAATNNAENIFLWVLEKNENARAFYHKFGFTFDGYKKLEDGTNEYLLRYTKK